MRSKKGAATVVAWVLLLGFSIGLATTIFLWTTRQTEEMSESAVRYVEGGMQCDNVMINVANTTGCSPEKTCCLKVSNTRYLKIDKVIVRALERVKFFECDDGGYPLNVTDYMFCSEAWAPQNVSIMPIIKVNNDMVACKNKAITVQC